MTVEYLDLNDYLAIAVEVTGWDIDTVGKADRRICRYAAIRSLF